MTNHRFAVLVVLSLCAAGCSPVASRARTRANALYDQGKKVEAEAHVANVMDGIVTNHEFRRLIRVRCDVRLRLATDEVQKFTKSGDATLEDIERLHEYVRRCPDFGDADNKITNLGIQIAERNFVQLAEPKAAAGDYYGALGIAAGATVHLPEGHPRGPWIEGQRAALAAPFAAGHAQYAQKYPMTSAVFARLFNLTLSTPTLPSPVEEITGQRFETRRANAIPISTTLDCAGFAGSNELSGENKNTGGAYQAISAEVGNCELLVDIAASTETYEVPVRKLQAVKTQVAVTRPVTTSSTTVTKSCRSYGDGFGSGCDVVGRQTTTTTRNVTTFHTVTEMKEVTVMEPRTRPIRVGIATLSAKVGVRISGFGSEEVAFETFSVATDRLTYPAETPDDTIRYDLQNATLAARFSRELPTKAAQAADAAAKAARATQLQRQADEALAAGDVDGGRELALTAWAGGTSVSPNQAATFDIFGVKLADHAPDDLPAVAQVAWLDTTATTVPFVQQPLDNFFEGIVVRGYPTNVTSIGGGYREPETLLAQPKRAAADLVIDGDFRWSLMTGKFHRGLGLLFGVDWGVSIGKRLGPDYERLVPLPFYVDEESAKEVGVTLGMRFGLPAMVGFRVFFVSLFAGVRPTYTNYSIGHFFSEGGSVPLAGRLELRLLERFPIVVEGWYGGLAKGPNEDIGGTLLLPISPSQGEGGTWLRARFDRSTLPAEIPGLFENDDVFVPSATSNSASLSIGFAF